MPAFHLFYWFFDSAMRWITLDYNQALVYVWKKLLPNGKLKSEKPSSLGNGHDEAHLHASCHHV